MTLYFKYIFLGIILVFTACNKDEGLSHNCSLDLDLNQNANTNPNILLIIADDMGIEVSPCHNIPGSIKPQMPNLQNLCNEGLVFNNAWSHPFCAPTRASIITGKYGVRTGVLNIPTDNTIELSEESLQTHIRLNSTVQYKQAIIGKWHLSNESDDANYPAKMGIEHFDGVLTGTLPSYFSWKRTTNGNTKISNEYATTALTDAAINWINECDSEPWFLWLSYTAPHKPFHLPPDSLHTFENLDENQEAIDQNPLPYYLAMLESLDHEMGRLLKTIPKEVIDNTTIIFLSDNGSPMDVAQDPFGPYKVKGSLGEGGINIPLIVSGKTVNRKQEVENALISTSDLFSTIGEIAGTNIVEIHDSKSFKALLQSDTSSTRKYNYSDKIESWAIRDEQFKYIKKRFEEPEFYDIINDPFENINYINSSEDSIIQRINLLSQAGMLIREE